MVKDKIANEVRLIKLVDEMLARTRAGIEEAVKVDADHEGQCFMDENSRLRQRTLEFVGKAFEDAQDDTWDEDDIGKDYFGVNNVSLTSQIADSKPIISKSDDSRRIPLRS